MSRPGGDHGGPGRLGYRGYGNPLRGVKNLTPERVDMGVDYSGIGPIYALGPGVIVNTENSGWPGGAFIAERLTAGPAAGKYVYAAEDITPTVQVGQQVDSSTQIGDVTGGIETGWAEPPGSGWALGRHQFSGSNATAYGASYSRLLHALGAPAGVISGPVSGSVPPGFDLGAGLVPGPGSGSGAGNQAGGNSGSGALSGLFSIPSDITKAFSTLDEVLRKLMWLLDPANWARIIAGVLGFLLLAAGLVALIKAASA